MRLFERFDAEEAFSTLTTMNRALRFDACRNASRTKSAKNSPNAKVQVHVVFCYTIEVHATRQSVDAHQSINSFRRPFFSRASLDLTSSEKTVSEFAENCHVKKRSDASSRQSQRSADVESGWRRARRSRRRVERDASANASRRVRAARPYRERGLLFFVLDACGAVGRRPGETRAVPKVRCAFVVRYFLLSRDSFGTPSSEARACGAREARGATGIAGPAAGHAVALSARKKPPGSTSRTTRTRRRGDVANGRRARVVGIRESEGEASAEARLGEHVVVPHEHVADGHLGTR